ncbi:hypothetical protein J5N97_016551 [Dioscorea zingiberensis]|uniref:glutathione transferase n=1 Tax=Dioscorea zingiberensis TaxID=325984 RepID=A0A9D5CJL4_9LILI|nr:hypothetical protein J5N97_016551 [Dioscorea zingiberensis]
MAGSGVDVKLVGMIESPFVVRAMIALNLKRVQYEFLEEKFGCKSDLLVRSNPVYKKMPVLIHQGRPICESMIIVEYLDQVWPGDHDHATGTNSILPSTPYQAAIARFWAHYIDDKWLPKLIEVMKGETEEAKAEAAKQVISGLQLLEEVFEQCSDGKAFFGGDTIGYLDIALGCFITWIKATEKISGFKLLQQELTPLLVAWAQCFCLHVAVKDVMPETDRLVEHAKRIRAWRIEAKATENNAAAASTTDT